MAYEVVTFFTSSADPVQLPDKASYQWRNRGATVGLINLLCRSARHNDPDVAFTILTDMATDLGGLDVEAQVIRHDLNTADLMLSRTKAEAEFVEGYSFNQPVAFLDTDILVNRPLSPLFARRFDVGLTWRRKKTMPLNGGVLFANNREPDRVRRFFRSFVSRYECHYGDQTGWWGDQRALNDIVNTEGHAVTQPEMLAVDGIEYLLLPGRHFNYSPHALALSIPFAHSSKYILHFKGPARKRFMKPFFDRHFPPDRWTKPSAALSS